jgi:Rho GDP-dissociation inhibitor
LYRRIPLEFYDMASADGDQPSSSHHDDLEPEVTKGYKPPDQKTVIEILKADAEDESLNKYKSILLQGAAEIQPPFPDDKRNVVVSQLSILVDDRPDMTIELSGDITNLKSKPIILKEGSRYKVKIYYYVQREIVSGLKYIMASYRGPVKVDKDDVMLGSYAPRLEPYTWTSDVE